LIKLLLLVKGTIKKKSVPATIITIIGKNTIIIEIAIIKILMLM
jgi:hypothetical protein